MYFLDRFDLGGKMIPYLSEHRGTEAVVVYTKDEAIGAALAVASQLRAWVYPLIIEPIRVPGDERVIGVVNEDGTLCRNPAMTVYDHQYFEMEFHGVIADASRVAFSKVNARIREFGEMKKDIFRGRTVIIVDDVTRDTVAHYAIEEMLKPIKTIQTISIGGNVDAVSAEYLRIRTNKSICLDVMTNMFDDDHYFEKSDPYTAEQKKLLVTNIAHYWQ